MVPTVSLAQEGWWAPESLSISRQTTAKQLGLGTTPLPAPCSKPGLPHCAQVLRAHIRRDSHNSAQTEGSRSGLSQEFVSWHLFQTIRTANRHPQTHPSLPALVFTAGLQKWDEKSRGVSGQLAACVQWARPAVRQLTVSNGGRCIWWK